MPIDSGDGMMSMQNSCAYFLKFRRSDDNFESLWRMKKAVRSSILGWLLTMPHVNRLTAETAAGCAGELLENSIKYTIGDSYAYIRLFFEEGFLIIEAANRTTVENLKNAGEIISLIDGRVSSREELYLEQVRKAVGSAESRIGLCKIAMESKGDLNMKTNPEDPDFVTFRIRMSIT